MVSGPKRNGEFHTECKHCEHPIDVDLSENPQGSMGSKRDKQKDPENDKKGERPVNHNQTQDNCVNRTFDAI